MSGYQQKDNNGSLFKNARKQEPKHPDYTGSGMINGEEMWISAWVKKSDKGTMFMSLAFSPKEENSQSGGNKSRPAPPREDDGMPF